MNDCCYYMISYLTFEFLEFFSFMEEIYYLYQVIFMYRCIVEITNK